jgi:hypothetical protein
MRIQEDKSAVQYANWWSKALFKKNFEKQHFIPLPPRTFDKALLQLIERTKFKNQWTGVEIEKPIFIVGLPRSGTTLLYNLLCAHEQAAFITNSMNAFPDAPCAIEWLRKKLNLNIRGERFLADSIDTDFGSPSEPILFWAKWFGRDVESLYWRSQRREDLSPGQVATIRQDIKKILYTFGGGVGRRLVMKYPVMQTELEMVQDLFPDARFIHIIRDGREVANSLVKLYKLSNNQLKAINHPTVRHIIPYPRVKSLATLVEKYGADSVECTSRLWQDAIELVEETRPHLTNFYEVRYEDLLKEPKEQLKKLLDFCELKQPGAENIEYKSVVDSIGHIRHKNNYSQYDVIERAVGPALQRLGYM